MLACFNMVKVSRACDRLSINFAFHFPNQNTVRTERKRKIPPEPNLVYIAHTLINSGWFIYYIL